MGFLNVTRLKTKKDRANYIHHLLGDIKALEEMIEKEMIEESPIRIGAEQEFCIVNSHFLPASQSLELLEDINDSHFTTEINKYNLEINLDPQELTQKCFSKLHKQLDTLLAKAERTASKRDIKIILAGILPSLSINDVDEQSMTNIERYSALNEEIKKIRKQGFYIHIKGVDELNLLQKSVMIEGCNTSFQMHLQVNPKTFIDTYNWAQAISGPVLGVCANSPILFGKELWMETRIALFTQSFDTRAHSFLLNDKQSRVSFGSHWQTGSITDIFKGNISRFRSFLTTHFKKNSVYMLEKNEIPKLMALRLHNGTVYPWNRVCYGTIKGNPNLRIENRYIPSGPTTADEIANMMFWVGVMTGKPKKYNNIHEQWDFKDVKTNFFNAAHYGMATLFYWDGKRISAQDLILNELLPIARDGMLSANISPADIDYYLGIIRERVQNFTGSEWLVRNYRHLLKTQKRFEAMQTLTAELYKHQKTKRPVATWTISEKPPTPVFKSQWVVKHIMNSDIFSVDKKDSLELVLHIMKWKHIHHVPVITSTRELIGLLTWKDICDFENSPEKLNESVSKHMKTRIITIDEYTPVNAARKLMKDHAIGCLPVVKGNEILGLITKNDFK